MGGKDVPALLTRAKSSPLHSSSMRWAAASISLGLVTSRGKGMRIPVF